MKKVLIIFILIKLTCSCDSDLKINETRNKKHLNYDSLKKQLLVESQKESNDILVLKITDELLKLDSSDYETWKCRAESFSVLHKYNQAFYSVNKAISIYPNGYIYHVKGMLFTYCFNDDSTDFYLKKAEKLDSNLMYLYKLHYYYKSERKHEKSIAVLDYAIKKYPKELSIYAHKGLNLLDLENWEKAIVCFNIAESEYKFDELYYGRAIAYSNINKYKSALKDLDIAIQKDPAAKYYSLRGVVKYHLKDIDGAIKDLKISSEMGDQDGIKNYNELLGELKKTKNI